MQIARRSLLRAAGVGLALPLLESMSPAWGAAIDPPKRMIVICATLGLHGPNFFPKQSGANYEPPIYLQELERHRKKLTVFSGMSHPDQAGVDGHSSQLTWLTSAPHPGLGGFRNSISIDQYARQRLGNTTRFPALTLSTEGGGSQSYTAGGVMVNAEYRPSVLFEQMFLQGKPEEIALQRQSLREGRSILDLLSSQTKSVQQKASVGDRRRLDEYFHSLREAEREYQQAEQWTEKEKPAVEASVPTDVKEASDIVARTRMITKLLPLVIQTDSSRLITFVIQGRNDVPPIEGVSMDHHNLSHHGQDETKIAQLQRIETELIKCFGELLDGLQEKSESGSTLLDNTAIMLGSNLGNANSHDSTNLPVLLAGGRFAHGSHVAYDAQKNTPLSNLFLSLLDHLGIECDRFGSSTGKLQWN